MRDYSLLFGGEGGGGARMKCDDINYSAKENTSHLFFLSKLKG
jgi:hypothetical protein